MTRMRVALLLICSSVFISTTLAAQENKKDRSKNTQKRELRRITPDDDRSFRELERAMERIEHSFDIMQDFELPPLPEIPVLVEIPPLPDFAVLAEIPELHVEIPEIHIPEIVIPEIAAIPPIDLPDIRVEIPAVPIPDIDFESFFIEGEPVVWGGEWHSSAFHDLSEQEELRIQALRAVARDNDADALAMIEKVLRQDESAAVRYQAVRMLRKHLDNDKAIDLLGDRARYDQDATVKKAAIRLLGKSGSPRAVDILLEIVQNK